eukprot:Opistho-2@86862
MPPIFSSRLLLLPLGDSGKSEGKLESSGSKSSLSAGSSTVRRTTSHPGYGAGAQQPASGDPTAEVGTFTVADLISSLQSDYAEFQEIAATFERSNSTAERLAVGGRLLRRAKAYCTSIEKAIHPLLAAVDPECSAECVEAFSTVSDGVEVAESLDSQRQHAEWTQALNDATALLRTQMHEYNTFVFPRLLNPTPSASAATTTKTTTTTTAASGGLQSTSTKTLTPSTPSSNASQTPMYSALI